MDAQTATASVNDFVFGLATSRRWAMLDAEDLAQESLVNLFKWFSKSAPADEDEARTMAAHIVQRTAGKMMRWATRECRDVRRTLGGESLTFNQPACRPDLTVEFYDSLDQTGVREAAEMKTAGYTYAEIGERLGGNGWRYRVNKEVKRVFQVA